MSYIRKLSNNKFCAEISKNYTSIQSKTFFTKIAAESWANELEKNIDTILSIKTKKLSPQKVEELGGVLLFKLNSYLLKRL